VSEPRPALPSRDSFRFKLWKAFTKAHVAAYRLTGGRVGKKFRGAPVVLVDHVGRKTGRRYTSPLMYVPDGDDVVIIASFGGAHKDPLWWTNLKANPRTTIQVNGDRREVVARQATSDERARLWPQAVATYGDYERYQRATEREIPVIVLSPAG
jgi:F420H(2)-dependent quinone reductase